ncbi:MAG TPA: D-glucuronyl C5-epimerase family protein [Chitinophagaceae bacterium]
MRATVILIFASCFAAALLLQWKGNDWEQDVRSFLYRSISDSVPSYSREYIDENEIPFVVYEPLNGIHPGKRYNPTIVANYAVADLEKLQTRRDTAVQSRFLKRADWLLNELDYTGDYAVYRFNWQQPWYDSVGVPFTCGMTSGLAMQVFTGAWQLTGKAGYLQGARALMRGFYVPIDSGGFTYKDPDGWWYEEIADTGKHTPRILDGHIFAITGIQYFREATGDDSAAYVVQRGIEVLRNRLKTYDAGNWSIYDAYGKRSDQKYHRLLTAQMKQLADITGDRFFLHYYHEWKKPLDRPYLLKVVGEGNRSGIMLFLVCWAAVFLTALLLRLLAKQVLTKNLHQ